MTDLLIMDEAEQAARDLLTITQGDLSRIGLIYERLPSIQLVARAYLARAQAETAALTPSPTGTELALTECKTILKHLVASIEHESRYRIHLLSSTVEYCETAKKFLSDVPQ